MALRCASCQLCLTGIAALSAQRAFNSCLYTPFNIYLSGDIRFYGGKFLCHRPISALQCLPGAPAWLIAFRRRSAWWRLSGAIPSSKAAAAFRGPAGWWLRARASGSVPRPCSSFGALPDLHLMRRCLAPQAERGNGRRPLHRQQRAGASGSRRGPEGDSGGST